MVTTCSSETPGFFWTTHCLTSKKTVLFIVITVRFLTPVFQKNILPSLSGLKCVAWGSDSVIQSGFKEVKSCRPMGRGEGMVFCMGEKEMLVLFSQMGTHSSVIGWGTMLLGGRSPVPVPDEVDFFNSPNPSSRTMALGSTQPLTEMSTMNLPGGKKRVARRADNLAAICELNVWKCGSLNLSQT
jgi:hypothetical protein